MNTQCEEPGNRWVEQLEQEQTSCSSQAAAPSPGQAKKSRWVMRAAGSESDGGIRPSPPRMTFPSRVVPAVIGAAPRAFTPYTSFCAKCGEPVRLTSSGWGHAETLPRFRHRAAPDPGRYMELLRDLEKRPEVLQ